MAAVSALTLTRPGDDSHVTLSLSEPPPQALSASELAERGWGEGGGGSPASLDMGAVSVQECGLRASVAEVRGTKQGRKRRAPAPLLEEEHDYPGTHGTAPFRPSTAKPVYIDAAQLLVSRHFITLHYITLLHLI